MYKTAKIYTIFGTIICFSVGFAQENEPLAWKPSVNLHYGVVLPHRPIVKNLVNQHINGLEISLERHAQSALQSVYNNSKVGHNVVFFNFRNPALGKEIAYYPYFQFLDKKYLKIRIGIGAAYFTHPFDRQTNPENLMISTRISGVLHSKFTFTLPKSPLNIGLSFTHASNGSIKVPNYGINILTASVGYAPQLNVAQTSQTDTNFTCFSKKNNKNRIEFGIAMKESHPSGGQKFGAYSLGISRSANINDWLNFTYGIDGFYNRALLNEQAKAGLGADSPDIKQVALVLGTEFWVGDIVGTVQYAYYVYQPYVFVTNSYSKLGLRYDFKNHYGAGIRLKSHGGKADIVELFMQYQW